MNPAYASTLRSLNVFLTRIKSSPWPDVAWKFSSLTEDGFPVEFTFSTSDNVVRYTTEVGGPEVPEPSRLNAAYTCLRELELAVPPAPERAAWQKMQAEGALRWGAWLGIRHHGEAVTAKLYAEVPRTGSWHRQGTLIPSSRLHMVGCDLASGAMEHYFKVGSLDEIEHETLLRSFRKQPHWLLLLEKVSALCGLPGESPLRWKPFGYSLADSKLTLFFHPRSLGGSASVRRAFLDAASEHGNSSYLAFLGEALNHHLPDHGVVALAVNAGGVVEMRVGISAMAVADAR